jgi:hypothetical protein
LQQQKLKLQQQIQQQQQQLAQAGVDLSQLNALHGSPGMTITIIGELELTRS